MVAEAPFAEFEALSSTPSVSLAAPIPAERRTTLSAAVRSLMLPRLPRTSGTSSRIAASAVIRVSSRTASVRCSRSRTRQRTSATSSEHRPSTTQRTFSMYLPEWSVSQNRHRESYWYPIAQRLEGHRKECRGKQVRLPEAEGGKSEDVPGLPQQNPQSREQQGGEVGAATVRPERIEALREHEDQQQPDQQAGLEQAQHRGELSPAGTRDVGCPEITQVGPLPGAFQVPVEPGMWAALETPGSRSRECWATRTVTLVPGGSTTMLPGPG